jgi:threonine synthase
MLWKYTLDLHPFCQPYNFERILFYLTNGETSLIKQWMTEMDETQKLTLDSSWLAKLRKDIYSARITDDETCNTLKLIHDTFDYVVDPHTAVALAAADKLDYPVFRTNQQGSKNPVVILATASPCKFEEAVTVALGQEGWDKYMQTDFPSRAAETMKMAEKEPYHFDWPEGAELSDIQSDWKKRMLAVVEESFRLND